MTLARRWLTAGALLWSTSLGCALLSGCGPRCGDGTVDQDGVCAPESVCGVGTRLEDGKCVVDDGACAPGTVNLNGQCLTGSAACASGTTFDSAQRRCVPNLEILCGDGTERAPDGFSCALRADACARGTLRDGQGRCVIASPACGEGAQLDPNTLRCVATSVACGAGTSFDSGNGVCVPSGSICEPGTVFNTTTATCTLVASCRAGDVVVDGLCTPPGEDLLARAEVREVEPNDTIIGPFQPNTLTLKPAGELLAFSGVIGEPVDLSGDGEPDQDVDQFAFTAQPGELFELTVQPIAGPALSLNITTPSGDEYQAPVGFSYGAGRQFMATEAGTYLVTIAPVGYLNGTITRLGDASWQYLGTITRLAQPGYQAVDLSGGPQPLAGDFLSLEDNGFVVTGFSGGNAVRLSATTFGEDMDDAVAHIFDASGGYVGTYDLLAAESATLPLDGSGALRVRFDWRRISGADTAFSFDLSEVFSEIEPNDTKAQATTVQLNAEIEAIGTAGTDVDVFKFVLPRALGPNEGLRVRTTSDTTSSTYKYDCRILTDAASDDEVMQAYDRSQGCDMWLTGLPAGTYYYEMTTRSSVQRQNTIQIMEVSGDYYDNEYAGNDSFAAPQQLGTFAPAALPIRIYGATDLQSSGPRDEDYFKFTLSQAVPAGSALTITSVDNGPLTTSGMRIDLYDAAQTKLNSSSSQSITLSDAPAGDYFIHAYRTTTTSGYDGLHVITVDVQ